MVLNMTHWAFKLAWLTCDSIALYSILQQQISSACDRFRPQLPVPVWMEGGAVHRDGVRVRLGARPPAAVRPRLRLHPPPQRIHLPLPPGDGGDPLRERSRHLALTATLASARLLNGLLVVFCPFSREHQRSVLQRQAVVLDVLPAREDQAQDRPGAAVPAFVT